MAADWAKFHTDVLDSPKVMALPPELYRTWSLLLLVAKRAGAEGILPPVANIAFVLRIDNIKAEEQIARLITAGLIDETDDGIRLHDWNDWQNVESDSAERVRRYRNKKRVTPATNVTLHETCNVTALQCNGVTQSRVEESRVEEREENPPLPPNSEKSKANPNPKTPPEFDSSLDAVWKKISDGLEVIHPKRVRAEFTKSRRDAIVELVAEGRTPEQILSACRWFFTSADERAVNARKTGSIDTVLKPDLCTKYFEFSTDPDAWGKTRDGPEVAAKFRAAEQQRRLIEGANRAG